MRKPNNRYVKELVYKLMARAPRTVFALIIERISSWKWMAHLPIAAC
jgi:hypothetical protein